jgi:hypothetical protein
MMKSIKNLFSCNLQRPNPAPSLRCLLAVGVNVAGKTKKMLELGRAFAPFDFLMTVSS